LYATDQRDIWFSRVYLACIVSDAASSSCQSPSTVCLRKNGFILS